MGLAPSMSFRKNDDCLPDRYHDPDLFSISENTYRWWTCTLCQRVEGSPRSKGQSYNFIDYKHAGPAENGGRQPIHLWGGTVEWVHERTGSPQVSLYAQCQVEETMLLPQDSFIITFHPVPKQTNYSAASVLSRGFFSQAWHQENCWGCSSKRSKYWEHQPEHQITLISEKTEKTQPSKSVQGAILQCKAWCFKKKNTLFWKINEIPQRRGCKGFSSSFCQPRVWETIVWSQT